MLHAVEFVFPAQLDIHYFITDCVYQGLRQAKQLQSNSVIANSTGPWKYVRYNHEFVITVNISEVKPSLGTSRA